MSNSAHKEISGIYRLTDLEISFVSACAQGANPGAKVLLKKEKMEMHNHGLFTKEGVANKDKPVNINIDVDGLSKSISDNIKSAFTDLLAKNKDVTADVLADTVVAVVTGDITKMQKSMTDELQKAIADVQKDIDDKLAKVKEDKVDKGADEVVEINGQSFKKSAIGDAAFAAIKASAIQSESLRKEIEQTKLVARVEKEFPNVAGKPEDKAALLALIEKATDPVKECGLQILKALNETGAEFKKEVGGNGKGNPKEEPKELDTDNEATKKLDKMAKDMAQKENISIAAAYAKVIETPEGTKLYEEHLLAQ